MPRLTPTQIAALDALDATCDDPASVWTCVWSPATCSGFTITRRFTPDPRRDGDGNGRARHLLRCGSPPPDARALPGAFAERFGDLRVGAGRGGIRVEGQTPFCALEPGLDDLTSVTIVI